MRTSMKMETTAGADALDDVVDKVCTRIALDEGLAPDALDELISDVDMVGTYYPEVRRAEAQARIVTTVQDTAHRWAPRAEAPA